VISDPAEIQAFAQGVMGTYGHAVPVKEPVVKQPVPPRRMPFPSVPVPA
jgi:hypothetical protein